MPETRAKHGEIIITASTLLIPTVLCAFTDGQEKAALEGHTVEQLIVALAVRYSDIQPHLYSDVGALCSFINLYVGEHNIRTIGGLEMPVSDGVEVLLVPVIAGGIGKAT